jgi:thymidylate synthase
MGDELQELIKNLDNDMDLFKKIMNTEDWETSLKLNSITDNKNVVVDTGINPEEFEYLKLVKNIVINGIDKKDRTGIGTKSIFGGKLEFNISKHFPLFTHKKMWLKGIFEELMWILSGSTDTNILKSKKVNIWNGNSSRDFLDSRNLYEYEEGDIGPTYGFAVRSYGAIYEGCKKNYIGEGIDQLEYVIDLIKNEPDSRRILINLWDPNVINDVALTPCMMTYNFYVDTVNNKLNLQAYIRSSDTLLGLPWNCSYMALLVYLICNLEDINLTPGQLNIITGDQHIYKNHFSQANDIINRSPKKFPTLKFKNKVKNITDYKWDDLILIDYNFNEIAINASMAI